MKKCECPYEADGSMPTSAYSLKEIPAQKHKPNKCKCTNDLAVYKRGKIKFTLCSGCFLPGDVRQ